MAHRALSLAPPVRLAPPDIHILDISFSPDGDWLAAIETREPGEVYLWPADGGDALRWQVHRPELAGRSLATWCSFVSDSVLATYADRDPVYRLWSVPGSEALQTLPRELEIDAREDVWRAAGVLRRLNRFAQGADDVWTQNTRGFDRVADFDRVGKVAAALDLSGELLAYADGGDLCVEKLGDPSTARRLVGRSETSFQHIAWSPRGDRIATWHPEAGMALWSPSDRSLRPLRTWVPDEPLNITDLVFDATGTFLAAAVFGKNDVFVWDLAGPPAAEPWRWSRSSTISPFRLEFDPTSSWLAAAFHDGVALWPIERGPHPHLLRGHTSRVRELAFAPDGSWLVSGAEDGTVRWWPLVPAAGAESRVLFDWGRPWVRVPYDYYHPHFLAVAPDGSWVATTGQDFDTVNVVPVGDGETRRLRSGGEPLGAVAVSPDGRRLAVAASASVTSGHILIWELESDAVTRLETEGRVLDLQFLPDGSLLDVVLAPDSGTIGRWNLDTGEREPIDSSNWTTRLASSADGRHLLCFGNEEWEGRPIWPPTHVALAGLGDGTTGRLANFGGSIGSWYAALSASGGIAVVPAENSLLVGRTSGGEPHRILFQQYPASAISPDERWIATGERSGDILLWPMPDFDRAPLGTLPHGRLITKLRSLTNLRAVRDDASADRWGIHRDPFPGWAEMPEW
jgi:WD40 repeat protein